MSDFKNDMSLNFKKLKLISFVALLIVALLSLVSFGKKSEDGPFFGNGFHNGWADQNSIVIWTRLTKTPNAKSDGTDFLVPPKKELKELEMTGTREDIMKAQIPKGVTLDLMNGACPGAPGEVKLIYYPLNDKDNKKETDWEAVDNNKNFTKQWRLKNLLPGTKYAVKIQARKNKNSKISDETDGAFRTAPVPENKGDMSFCIVTCQEYWKKDTTGGHKIYDAMLKLSPDFYVHTGDIEYYDRMKPYALTEELMRFKWDRIFALPLQRTFWSQVTSYYMKDDHDALGDDVYPGLKYGTVSYDRGLEIFDKEQFPTNDDISSNDKPYKTIRWGKDIQIWITADRNYRSKNTDPDGPKKTILGKEQKEWLFSTLQESDATFKILITPIPILGPDREKKQDNYSNSDWKYEGDEIRNFVKQFDNVFICTGDRHWQYVTHWPNTNLWEFGAGPSSDAHAGGWSSDDVRLEHRFLRIKGGFLKGSVNHYQDKAILKLQHFDVDGNVVHEEVFKH
jgi:alkaline phosphatase D